MEFLKNIKGFSLLELIISLGLVGLVLSVGGLMYFTGVKGWNHSENQVEIQQNLRIAINTLSTEIRKADDIEIDNEKKINLIFDTDIKTYYFDEDSQEIRLGTSTTVAMYIEKCEFKKINDDLLQITIKTISLEGKPSKTFVFNINTRGKLK